MTIYGIHKVTGDFYSHTSVEKHSKNKNPLWLVITDAPGLYIRNYNIEIYYKLYERGHFVNKNEQYCVYYRRY